jgi:hypothetical protein
MLFIAFGTPLPAFHHNTTKKPLEINVISQGLLLCLASYIAQKGHVFKMPACMSAESAILIDKGISMLCSKGSNLNEP